MNETLKVLKERRSVRKYKAEQIRDEELNAILEAGTWRLPPRDSRPLSWWWYRTRRPLPGCPS